MKGQDTMPAVDHGENYDIAELNDFATKAGPYHHNRIEAFLQRNIVLRRETPADGDVKFNLPGRAYSAGSGPEEAIATATANPNWLRNKARNYLAIADRIEQDEATEDTQPPLKGPAAASRIIIDRSALPVLDRRSPPSGRGTTYVTKLAGGTGVHSSVGADHARERALEWLAIAEDIEQQEARDAERKQKKRKDEICRQFDIRAYEDVQSGPAGRMIDRIYELEQKAAQ